MKLDIKSYPGSKAVSGFKQQFFNILPKAHVYYDLFGGSGAVAELIRDEDSSATIIYNEIDHHVFLLAKAISRASHTYNWDYRLVISSTPLSLKKIFYCDPPYLMDTRKSKRNIYNYEWDENEHLNFINYVQKEGNYSNSLFIISHYPCELYDKLVTENKWNKREFEVATRNGVATEALYFNFDPVKQDLLTYKYLGKNNTDRQRIKRYQNNMLKRIKQLPMQEKKAMLQLLQNTSF